MFREVSVEMIRYLIVPVYLTVNRANNDAHRSLCCKKTAKNCQIEQINFNKAWLLGSDPIVTQSVGL